MDCLYIYGKNFSLSDKEFILSVLSYAGIEKGFVKFIDLTSHDPINSRISLCFDNTHSSVARTIVNSGTLSFKDFLSGNTVSKDLKFIFFSLPISIPECRSTEKNKDYLWDKVCKLASYMKEYGYIPDDTSGAEEETSVVEEAVEEEPELSKSDLEKEFYAAKTLSSETKEKARQTVLKKTEDEEKEIKAFHTSDTLESSISIDVQKLLNEIVDKMSVSDASLGKSLSLTKKVTFENDDGVVINVFPTNRIDNNSDGLNMSFKDMVATIKMAIVLDSKKITFHKG
mgnify:FL=1